jgi:hypothetical protein
MPKAGDIFRLVLRDVVALVLPERVQKTIRSSSLIT